MWPDKKNACEPSSFGTVRLSLPGTYRPSPTATPYRRYSSDAGTISLTAREYMFPEMQKECSLQLRPGGHRQGRDNHVVSSLRAATRRRRFSS
jgi:hypothetical protein